MKLVTRIKGGLGNQLYCYAAARRLALVNNCELIIDDISGFSRDFQYQRSYMLNYFDLPFRKATRAERFFPMNRVRRFAIKKLAKMKDFKDRNYIEQEIVDFDPRLLDVKLHQNATIDGLWQSASYFSDVEDIVRKDLYIKPPSDEQNTLLLDRIDNSVSVAVHIRWFGGEMSETNATAEYYVEALKQIEQSHESAHYFVFSDDPARSKQLITFPSENVTFVTHNSDDDEKAIWDFWLMSKCRHFIIANSTFSWWAAWLAEPSQERMVFYPKLRSEFKNKWTWDYTGQMPSAWKPIIVNI